MAFLLVLVAVIVLAVYTVLSFSLAWLGVTLFATSFLFSHGLPTDLFGRRP